MHDLSSSSYLGNAVFPRPVIFRTFSVMYFSNIFARTLRKPFFFSVSVGLIVAIRHASWRLGQQRSSSTPVCHWPASGWCPSCGSRSSVPLPRFSARLSSVDHASAFPLGSSRISLKCSIQRSSCSLSSEGILACL